MEEFAYTVLFITIAPTEEAQRISRMLLKQKKITCVNIALWVSSFFWWQDKIDSAQASLLIAKTKASQLTELVRMVKELHSYDAPEIIAIPIVGGNQDYLDWISNEVK